MKVPQLYARWPSFWFGSEVAIGARTMCVAGRKGQVQLESVAGRRHWALSRPMFAKACTRSAERSRYCCCFRVYVNAKLMTIVFSLLMILTCRCMSDLMMPTLLIQYISAYGDCCSRLRKCLAMAMLADLLCCWRILNSRATPLSLFFNCSTGSCSEVALFAFVGHLRGVLILLSDILFLQVF